MSYDMTRKLSEINLDRYDRMDLFDQVSESETEFLINQSENLEDNDTEWIFNNHSNFNCYHLSIQKSILKSHGIPFACGLGLVGNFAVTTFLIL